MRTLARLLLATILLTGLAACPPKAVRIDGRTMEVDEAARYELENARAKESAGDLVGAAELYEEVARRYADTAEADEALFGAARAWEEAGQPLRARAAYERLLAHYPSSDKVEVARARLAELSKGDAELAARAAAYQALPPDRKYPAAVENAAHAEASGNAAEAFRWRAEALQVAPPVARQEAEAALAALLKGLAPADVEALEVAPGSLAEPLVAWRKAELHQERRDWDELEVALHDFVARFGTHPLAEKGRELLGRIANRGVVEPLRIGVILPLSGPYKAYGDQLRAGIEFALRSQWGAQLRISEAAADEEPDAVEERAPGMRPTSPTRGGPVEADAADAFAPRVRTVSATRPIEVVFRDTRGEAEGAIAAIERLVYEDHVIAAIGGVITAEVDAAAVAADELGLPFVGFSRTEGFAEASEWIFRDMLTNSAVADSLVEFAMGEMGMNRFAILHPEIEYGQEMSELFRGRVEERGGAVSGVQSYAQDTTTFSEPIRVLVKKDNVTERAEYQRKLNELRLKGIKDARRRRNAIEKIRQSISPVIDFQALFVPDHWKTVALVAPALAFEDVITNWCDERDIRRIEKTTGQRVTPVMLLGGNTWNHRDLPARAGKYINCSVFVDGYHAGSVREETVRFVEAFTASRGRQPGMLEAYGAEAALAVRYAIESAAPRTRRAFIEAMYDIEGLEGPMGRIVVTEEGEVVHPLYLLTVDDGVIREWGVEPPPEGEDGAL